MKRVLTDEELEDVLERIFEREQNDKLDDDDVDAVDAAWEREAALALVSDHSKRGGR